MIAKDVKSYRGSTLLTVKQSDILTVVRGELNRIKRDAQRAASAAPNTITRYHLQDIAKRIDAILDPK